MKVIQVKKHMNNTVSKANELIKAKGELSGTAQKMLASIISMIRADDSELQQYALRIDDYLKLIGSKTNNNEFVKERAKELMRNPFEVDGLIFNWCSMVDTKSLAGYLVFDVHPKLKPYLLELKERGNFTQYKIVNILSLKGEYSPRLYEIFVMKWNIYKKHNPNAKSFSFELKILELRKMLNISKGYLYGDIKRRIIEKAKKQFKAKTDIQFDYKEQKIGRRVDRIIITVKDNNKGSNDYLRDLKSFISFYRKNKVNEDLYKDEKLCLSISERGRLYDKYTAQEYNKDDAMIVWRKLYEKAKKDELSDKIGQKNKANNE